MERYFLKIKNVVFRMELDFKIASQMLRRVASLSKSVIRSDSIISIRCKRVQAINFTDSKFLSQQEPDISDSYYYREVFGLGIFKYLRKEKRLDVMYLDDGQYPFDVYEVVVDTILQFIYLIMLEFDIVPLHASVLSYKDRAVLLFGNSGSGKTTLELSLLNSGFSFFSDDVAFLDEENRIYSSGECIIACTKKSEEILNKNFGAIDFQVENKNAVDKQILRVDEAMTNKHNELMPCLMIFPVQNSSRELCTRLLPKEAFVELIQLTISAQFNSEQKQLYMKRLKRLSATTQAFQYFWTKETDSLKEICNIIQKLCEEEDYYDK